MRSCFSLLTHRSIERKTSTFILISLALLIMIAGAFVCIGLYGYLFKSNVILHDRPVDYIYIPTGSGFGDVKKLLQEKKILKNPVSFDWAALRKHYDQKIKPGRYRISDGMSNNELINLLRSGKQDPVKVTFHNIRNREDLAGKISHQIEADSVSLLKSLYDEEYLKQLGVDPRNSLILFIPNTYEFYWNTSAKMFIGRMVRENTKFWNESRKEKCRIAGLSMPQASILASIIEKETSHEEEKPLIAGVYLNRLRKRWPLQADPTIIFAWNDYTIKRVLYKHIRINSLYNTYIHTGLPPGPICLPSIASIDAVLNFKHHNYMYFCAKDDLSGYHVFAETLTEHNRNAKKYQSALKKLNTR